MSEYRITLDIYLDCVTQEEAIIEADRIALVFDDASVLAVEPVYGEEV